MARSREVILDDDIVRFYEHPSPKKKNLVAVLFWGDRVRISKTTRAGHIVQLTRRDLDPETGVATTKVYDCLLPRTARLRTDPLLKVRFVDVGQGDGAIIETADGKLVLVDGGEESHMRRYLSAAFSHVLRRRPLACEAIVVTHGDADHFSGLTELVAATRPRDDSQPFLTAERLIHNGLVKQPGSSLGPSVKHEGRKFVTALFDDIRSIPTSRMNLPFRKWKDALGSLRNSRGRKPRMSRTVFGRDTDFAFMESGGLKVSVLGPIVDQIRGKDALPWLGDAGKTINGHSVVLKLAVRQRAIPAGGRSQHPVRGAAAREGARHGHFPTAEILKVPHHGSADFSPRMLEAVRPVVSVVSSGDENSAKEYIHPRAGLVGALGRFSRGTVDKPLVYVTEMVAFFRRKKKSFREYTKTEFGIVHVRTDGKRVLVATNSGRDDKKEAYAFFVDDRGDITFDKDVKPI